MRASECVHVRLLFLVADQRASIVLVCTGTKQCESGACNVIVWAPLLKPESPFKDQVR